jgi:SAM-dependent methyltransferase
MEPDPGYKDDLRRAYDADVARRDAMTPAAWRIETVDHFADVMGAEAISTVVELGCGTGQLAEYLATKGFVVSAVDLAPGNVAAARRRGVDAIEADFAALPFDDESFDAAFAFQSLIHVPEAELPAAIREIRRVLRVGAPLLMVVWGGERHEGTLPEEWLDPPRYFSFYDDEQVRALSFPGFELEDFATRDDTEGGLHAQILTLRAVPAPR